DRQTTPFPPACSGQSPIYALVMVSCSTYKGGAIVYDKHSAMILIRKMVGNEVSHSDSSGFAVPGDTICVDDGASHSWNRRPPRMGVPVFQDSSLQEYHSSKVPSSTTYYVCAKNVWGSVCGPGFDVTINRYMSPRGNQSCGPDSPPYRPCLL